MILNRIGSFWYAIATLTGTIVGVGMFGLPYVASRAGFFVGIVYIVVLAGLFVVLHLMFGEIMLRTNARHRLPGYVGIYFGGTMQRIFSSIALFTLSGGMLVYILVGGEFLRDLTRGTLGSLQTYFVLFWALLSVLLLFGLRSVKKSECIMLAAMVVIIVFIFIASIPHIAAEHFFGFSPRDTFLPYGVTLFALAGAAAIPAVRDILAGEERRMKRAIAVGTLIPAILYLLFVTGVVGVSGPETSENALSGLRGVLGSAVLDMGAVLGVFLVATSYLVFGLYLKDMLRYDVGMTDKAALGVALFVPVALVFVQWRSFIEIIGFLGALFGGVEGIFLVETFKKARLRGDRTPEYALALPSWTLVFLQVLLAAGVVYFLLFDGSVIV